MCGAHRASSKWTTQPGALAGGDTPVLRTSLACWFLVGPRPSAAALRAEQRRNAGGRVPDGRPFLAHFADAAPRSAWSRDESVSAAAPGHGSCVTVWCYLPRWRGAPAPDNARQLPFAGPPHACRALFARTCCVSCAGGCAGRGVALVTLPAQRVCGPTCVRTGSAKWTAGQARTAAACPPLWPGTPAPSARTMAWPTAEELRLDELVPPVGSCLFAALHPGCPLGEAPASKDADGYAGLDEFMGRVNLDGACGLRARGGGPRAPQSLTAPSPPTRRRPVRPVHRRGAPAAGADQLGAQGAWGVQGAPARLAGTLAVLPGPSHPVNCRCQRTHAPAARVPPGRGAACGRPLGQEAQGAGAGGRRRPEGARYHLPGC